MKNKDVVAKILAFHPLIEGYDENPEGCDHYKCGNPEDECKGIVTTIAASVDVLRKTAELGYNLIIVHEPAFYTHLDKQDWLENNEVYKQKMQIIKDAGITIWRDHDHLHRHQPDMMRYGIMKELGWENYLISDNVRDGVYEIPEIPFKDLVEDFKVKFHLNGVRITGNPDTIVRKVWFCGHIWDNNTKFVTRVDEENIDVCIPQECYDWTLVSYMRDAGQLGLNKAMLMMGHINLEELGMKYASKWIPELIENEVPVTFIPANDTFSYM